MRKAHGDVIEVDCKQKHTSANSASANSASASASASARASANSASTEHQSTSIGFAYLTYPSYHARPDYGNLGDCLAHGRLIRVSCLSGPYLVMVR